MPCQVFFLYTSRQKNMPILIVNILLPIVTSKTGENAKT